MKSRKEAIELINQQFQNSDGRSYGREQLRELLDFIYEGLPESEEEKLTFAGTMNLK